MTYVTAPPPTRQEELLEYAPREFNQIRRAIQGIAEGLYLNGLVVISATPYNMQNGDVFLLADPGGSTYVVNAIPGIHRRAVRVKNMGTSGAGVIRFTRNGADVVDQGNGTTATFFDVAKGSAVTFVFDANTSTWWQI